jgi:hypothetical protein
MSARRLTLTTLASLCALVGLFAFSDLLALAAVTHKYLSQITEVPASSGAAIPGPLHQMESMTVDSGHLWIAEQIEGKSRVDEFDGSTGAFVSQPIHAEPPTSYGGGGIALGHATGVPEVYVGESVGGEAAVAVFDESGTSQATWTGADIPGGSFGFVGDVAVDNSTSLSDWAAGDVYVTVPGQQAIDVFHPEAGGKEKYVTRLTGISLTEPFQFPFKVAVSGVNGDVVVLDVGAHAVDIFEPTVLGEYVFVRKITGPAPSGKFAQGIYNLAVDGGSGEIYVTEEIAGSMVISQFDSTGAYLGHFTGADTPAGGISDTYSFAVDSASHRVYVGDNRGNVSQPSVVDIFGPDLTIPDVTSEPASGVQPASATLNGTVNPDEAQVSDCHFEYGTSSAYGQSVPCAQTPAQIGTGNSPVAVSADLSGLTPGVVYHFRLSASNANGVNTGADEIFGPPQIESESATSVAQTTATLRAQVDPNGVDTTYRFEYGTSASYGASAPVPDGDLGAGTSGQGVSVNLTGLQAGVTYHYRVLAISTAGMVHGSDQTFTMVPPARIDSVTISDVAAESATLHARIDPLGTDTTYRFEWGTNTSYGTSVPVPDADIGAGTGDVAVTQKLTGLHSGTTYHVRVVATNSLGTERSGDHTFVYDTTGAGLPDNRAYEMVTPPQKNGATINNDFRAVEPDFSEDGSRVIMSSIQCFAGAESCTGSRQSEGEQFLFSRTSGGWTTTALAPPASRFDANSAWMVSAEAGTELFSMPIPPTNEDHFYIRRPDGSFVDVGPTTPPSEGVQGTPWSAVTIAATSDFSHIVYQQSHDWPFDASSGASTYEFVGTGNTAPLLVGVSGGSGSTDLISACGTSLGGEGKSLYSGSMSADGRTVYFTAAPCASGTGANASVAVPADGVYARIDQARTVKISERSQADCASLACQGSPAGDALFTGASVDGSKAFFTSTQQLTDNASEDGQAGDSASAPGCRFAQGPNGCNLYEYDFDNPAGHNLIVASAGDTSGRGPRVQGVSAISSDGSHVYFVAKSVLSTSPNGQGETAQEGADNLYMFEHDADHPQGRIAFVATLADADSQDWAGAGEEVNVTPDGRFLVFVSSARLTPDDARQDGARQVFRYDAQTGELIRLSIGEQGFDDNGNRSGSTDCAGTAGSFCPDAAKIVRAVFGFINAGPARSDPTMSHDGAYVFFESPVGLTPQALNEVQIGGTESSPLYAQNIYEWHDGHVYLISDGRDVAKVGSGSAVRLLRSDATGANVFFGTTDQLVAQDTDTQVDFYDARICTASDPCVAQPPPRLPPCLGEACHGTPAAAPLVPSSPSATFNGQGNVTSQSSTPKKATVKKKPVRCSKGSTRSHGKCVKKKPRRTTRRAKHHKGGK